MEIQTLLVHKTWNQTKPIRLPPPLTPTSSTKANLGITEAQSKYKIKLEKYEKIKVDYDAKMTQVRQTEELYQTLTTGMTAREGHENGFMEQIQG